MSATSRPVSQRLAANPHLRRVRRSRAPNTLSAGRQQRKSKTTGAEVSRSETLRRLKGKTYLPRVQRLFIGGAPGRVLAKRCHPTDERRSVCAEILFIDNIVRGGDEGHHTR